MRTPCPRITSLCILAGLVLTSGQLWAEQNKPADTPKKGSIIKWVDEKGVTHYGDRMPVQDANRNNSVLNNQGLVVQRDQPATVVKPEQDQASIDQQRHDRALRAAFSNEQEIDAARDRNLQTDETAINGLEQRMGIAQARMDANKKLADDFIKRKKPVPPDLNLDLQNNSTEITRIKQQIAQRQQSMEATRQRYDNDKRRFVELKPHDPNSPAAAPGEIAAPAPAPAPKPVSAAPAPKPATAKR
jgi:hypothetical protein